MNRDELFLAFCKCCKEGKIVDFQDSDSWSDIDTTKPLSSFGIDSLDALELGMALERKLELEVELDEARAENTIDELLDMVEDVLEQQAPDSES